MLTSARLVFPGSDQSVIDLTVVHIEHPARRALIFSHLALTGAFVYHGAQAKRHHGKHQRLI